VKSFLLVLALVVAVADPAGATRIRIADTYTPTADGITMHHCPKTFVGLGGEKGGGKTYAALAELIRLSMQYPGNRVMLFRQKLETLQTTTLNTFWRVCPPALVAEHVSSKKTIRLINGSEILYRGLSGNVLSSEPAIKHFLEDLKSLELGAVYINEGSQTRKEFWDTLKQTLRWIPPGVSSDRMFYRALVDSNPEPGWFHQTFIRSLPQDHAFVHFRAANNAHLAAGYYERFSDMPESWRRRYVEGRWEFDQEGDQWVYPYAVVMEACQAGLLPDQDDTRSWGLDPAGQGNDESVLTLRHGPVFKQFCWRKQDGTQLRDNVLRVLHEHGYFEADEDDRDRVNVDCHGMGAPIASMLREAGVNVGKVNLLKAPRKAERFKDIRSEMFWSMRERLVDHRAVLPDDDRLREQMVALMWEPDANGRICVEHKDVYKKRTGQSPDRLESLVYANYRSGAAVGFAA
jgi:hypothetical protein